MKKRGACAAMFLGGALALSLARPMELEAHLRNYLETYGYQTLEKGKFEMELWTDRRNPDSGQGYWLHQTELEYGVTERYTLGLYGLFIDGKGFSAFKIENRLRLAEPDQWPVDTALYFEIKKAAGEKTEDELEGKLIFSKQSGPWNLAANIILQSEREVKSGGRKEWELKPSLAAAAAYASGGRITPGVEWVLAEDKTRVIPGIYIDILPEVRLNLGCGIGLEKKAENFQFKSILEIEF